MATAIPLPAPLLETTLAGLLRRVPDVPHDRICMVPLPGTATEDDALYSKERLGVICELIDGTLVRKTVGLYESALALEIAFLIQLFLKKHKLGRAAGPDGPTRLNPGVLKYPDVSFFSWERLKKHPLKRGAAPELIPDLAIEVLSKGNTKKEMDRKLRDYFASKVRLVWYVDPKTKTARAWRSLKRCQEVPADGSLDGGDVLPGFKLNLAELFASVDELQ
jgi:Uma2 family endonuclease